MFCDSSDWDRPEGTRGVGSNTWSISEVQGSYETHGDLVLRMFLDEFIKSIDNKVVLH